MLGDFRQKVFVKVSGNPHMKVLASALFSSSLVDKRKISMIVDELKFFMSFNSSRHNCMFLIFCIYPVFCVT